MRRVSVTTFLGIARPHILGIAGAAAFTFGWIFSGKYSLVVPVLIMLDWFVVNLTNRAVDIDEDIRNGVPGTESVAESKRLVEFSCIALLVLSLGVGHFIAPETTWVRAVFHVIGLAYNYRLLPGKRRFKNLYFFKNSMSATLFVISVIIAPALHLGFADGASWTTAAWLAAFFFPLELTYEIMYDLRDVDGDIEERVFTYPVVHGEAGARRIIWSLLAAAAAIIVAGAWVGPLRVRDVSLLGGVILQAGIFFWWLKADRRPTVRDCVAVTWVGAALLMTYNVWVWVGLPLGS